MGVEYQVRRATPADVVELVDLHYRVFDEGTHRLMCLGRGFMKRAYLWYCGAPEAFCLVADGATGILGCVTANHGSYYQVCSQNWKATLWALSVRPELCAEPWLWRRLGDRLACKRGAHRSDGTNAVVAYAAWLAIDSAARGKGLGEALLRACKEECRAHGWNRILTAVHPDNLAARGNLRKVGFVQRSDGPGGDLIHLHLDIYE